jgi:beta-glucosidase
LIASLLGVVLLASCAGRSTQGNAAHGNPSATLAGASAGGSSSDGSGVETSGSGGAAAPSALPQFDCSAVASQQFDAAHMQPYSASQDLRQTVSAALAAMSPAERASQMLGVPVACMDYRNINRSPDVTVAGLGTIRGYWYRNGDRGVNLSAGQANRPFEGNDFSTAFPAESARAASWDLELEKRIGEAVGDEIAASLNNVALAPSMDIVRHPYWGRTQESYGEDPYQIGRMASAFTVGVQKFVVACAKNFVANNIEKNRMWQNAVMNEQTLREIYTRHFEMVVQDAGVGCIGAAYNMINGVKSTQNRHLLRDILKAPIAQGGMGFEGFVISDWWGMPGEQNVPDDVHAQELTDEAVQAGLDIEVPWQLHYRTDTLAHADPALVEEAVRRVLTQKFRFRTAFDSDAWSSTPPSSSLNDGSIATNAAHEALAEESALESAVLLRNGSATRAVLPLESSAKKIAVLGLVQEFSLVNQSLTQLCVDDPDQPGRCLFHFATDVALGDHGSSRVNADPARAVGPAQGIELAAGSERIVTSGSSLDVAADADAIVVVVGYTPGDEGEEFEIPAGGDRTSLDLPAGQNELVASALDLQKPTVIIVESGSIVSLPWLGHRNQNQATIWAGYGGQRSGAALGKLIFGSANFSGKMPMAWPTQAELDRTPFKGPESDSITAMGYFFGYREYDRRKAAGQAVQLVFPFGHGESYSSFEYSRLQVPCASVSKDAIVDVSVEIENTSAVDGDEVALLFVEPPPKPAAITGDRPVKELKSFARVSVKAGQRVTAHLPLRIADLRRWEGGTDGKWLIDSGAYTILVGKDADDAQAGANRATLTVRGD